MAVNYYQDRSDTQARFYTYYYLGRVHVNGNRLDQATLAFMNAEQEVETLGDDYAAGLLYTEMGDIYREYYDFPKAFDCYIYRVCSRLDIPGNKKDLERFIRPISLLLPALP